MRDREKQILVNGSPYVSALPDAHSTSSSVYQIHGSPVKFALTDRKNRSREMTQEVPPSAFGWDLICGAAECNAVCANCKRTVVQFISDERPKDPRKLQ